jgi:hypothetical protein
MSKFCRAHSLFWQLFLPSATVICCLAALLLLLPPFGGLAMAGGQLVEATVGPQIEVYAGAGGQSIGKSELTASRVAYDPTHNRFMVVWYDWRDYPDGGTWGRLLNGDGTLYGDAFSICTTAISQHYNPMVAFDSANQRFLVVWADNRFGSWYYPAWGAMGQFVGPDGSLHGNEFIISGDPSGEEEIGPFYPASLVYSSADQRFLVLFLRDSPYNLYGRFVEADGGLGGVVFPITDIQSGYGIWRITAAYDSNNNRFLVAYGNSTADQTCARLVNGDGVVGDEKVLSPVAKQLDSAAFDPVNSRFLVLWERAYGDVSSNLNDHGHLLNADLTPYGDQITLTLDQYPGGFDATYDAFERRFLVVGGSYNQPVFGRVLNLDGSLCGLPFTILDYIYPSGPYVCYGSQSTGALVVYGAGTVPENEGDILGNMVQFTVMNPDTSPILILLID